jgi:O-methyltransferase
MGLLGLWWACRIIPGDVIECGSYKGATGLLVALLGRENGLNQNVHLLDTFGGMPAPGLFDGSRSAGEFLPSADQVAILKQQAAGLGVTDRVKIHCGLFGDTFVELKAQKPRFSFAHIDANMYSSTLEACEFVLPRLNKDGAVVFDDYNAVCDLGARLAIDQYFRNRPERLKPLAGCSAYVSVIS